MLVPSNVLRDLRQKKNRTQKYIGTKLGMSQSQYNKLERGEKPMDLDTLIKLGEIFDVDPIRLFKLIYENGSIDMLDEKANIKDIDKLASDDDFIFYKKMAIHFEKKFLKVYKLYIQQSHVLLKNGLGSGDSLYQ